MSSLQGVGLVDEAHISHVAQRTPRVQNNMDAVVGRMTR
jgi:hypothetical protein